MATDKMPLTPVGKDRFGNQCGVKIDNGGKAWMQIGSGSQRVGLGRVANGEQAMNRAQAEKARRGK